MDENVILGHQFLIANPGARIVNIEDCLVPASSLNVSMVVQVKKPVPLLDEFILRFIQAGVHDSERIAGLLGLDEHAAVFDAIADLILHGVLIRGLESGLHLTGIGETRVKQLVEIVPTVHTDEFLFDRTVWQLSPVDKSNAIGTRDANDSGFRILPAASTGDITAESVSVADVERAILRGSSAADFDILRVQTVERAKSSLFYPGKLVVYTRLGESTLRTAVAVNGELSAEHSHALEREGGATALGISIDRNPERIDLPAAIAAQLEQVPQASALAATTGALPDVEAIPEPMVAPVYAISVFEHYPLLVHALETAARRVLIVSPWIKASVVNRDFMALLESCLRRNVPVSVVYGIGDEEESHADVLERLERLASRDSRFELIRHSSTHAKVLIWDDTCVKTSFNWLSFRGDKQQSYRQEEGVVIRIPEHAEQEYQRLLSEAREKAVKRPTPPPVAQPGARFHPGDVVLGRVKTVKNFGVFIELEAKVDGLLHISNSGCSDPVALVPAFPIGDTLKVEITEVSTDPRGRIRYALTRCLD